MMCKSCIYFERETPASTCHRYPPVRLDKNVDGISIAGFPVIDARDWCGEYKPIRQD